MMSSDTSVVCLQLLLPPHCPSPPSPSLPPHLCEHCQCHHCPHQLPSLIIAHLVFLLVDLIWISLRAGQVTYIFTDLRLTEFSGEASVWVLYPFSGSVWPTPIPCPLHHLLLPCPLVTCKLRSQIYPFHNRKLVNVIHLDPPAERTPHYQATLLLQKSFHKYLQENLYVPTL